jgi:hypothetical protein
MHRLSLIGGAVNAANPRDWVKSRAMQRASILLWCSVLLALGCGRIFAADPAYDPLWLYQGTWEFTKHVPSGTPVSNKIVNDYGQVGKFFMCQQTVDGKLGALVIFVPTETAGHYFTQALSPDGKAMGRGELEIQGDRWTYPSKEDENGKTKYYRTTNVFSGKDHIHFEQAESTDGKNWTVTASGDEVHTSQSGTRPDPRQDKRDTAR